MRSSVISVVEQSKVFPLQGGVGRKSILSRRHSETFQRPNHLRRGTAERTTKFHSLLPSTPPSPLKPPITADIYEPLTTAPDDPSVVRFSPTNGEIAAATPARLIAHITSPTFVDYELLSDFFLTFRSFLSTGELVEYLVARLQWAVNRSDDFGRIVRVRTFVALRHWILNYFVDDFLPSLQLRLQFCTLVNQLYRNLQARADHGGGDLKIVGELKKCWRRTCVLYWNESEATMADSSESEILPGGPDESTDAMAASAQSGQQVQGSIGRPPLAAHVGTAAVPSGNQQPGWSTMAPHAAQSSFTRELYSAQFQKQSNKFRASEQSMQVRSCSIPMLTSHRGDTNAARNVFPHPITDSPQHQVQHTTPAKRVASGHGHKRSGSFSDALRDHRTPLSQPKVSASDVPLSVHPFSGSLIRGAVFEPAPPDVDIAFSEDGDRKKSQLDLSLGERAGWSVDSLRTGPTSSQGMKKILGSVRRALSSRQPSSSVYGAGGNGEPAAASRSSEFHSRPSKARSSEGVHKKVRSRPPTRIDVLAAEAAEAFRKAVLAAIEKERGATAAALVSTTSVMDGGKQPSVDTKTKLQSPSGRLISNVTMGSRSIVIVDDTGPPKELLMSGAFRTTDWNARFPPGKSRLSQCPPEQTNPIGNAAVGGEGHLPHSGRGTTDQMPGNNQHAGPESYAGDAGKGSSDRSITQSAYVKRPPALRRSRSARSGPPTSNSLRRFASFQSGMGRAAPSQHTEGSSFSYIYSTTTPSEDASEPSEVESHPLRRLRRRPGGDLRAFENVHDLECQRPHSTGSLSNRSHSISNSVAFTSVDVTGGTFDTKPTTNFADEASRETKSETSRILRKPYSLVQTHSSQPNLRPSFEAEVAKLAALPDDEDDGGIESALLKLEGRYEKRSPEELPRSPFEDPSDSNDTSSTRTHREQKAVLTNAPRSPESGRAAVDPTQTYNTQAAPITPGDKQIPRAEVRPGPRAITTVRSVAGSEDSYSSVPLLQRGLSDAYTRKRGKGPAEYNKGASNFGMPSSPPPSSRGKAPSTVNGKSPQSPVARMGEPETMLKLPHNRAPPRMSVGGGSFLLDDNQSLSDLSSELSTELLDTSENDSHEVMSFFDDEDAGDSQPENEILSHPLRHPPTPPLSEKSLRKPPALDDSSFQQRLPTPGQTPVASAPIHLHTRSSFPLSPPAIEMADLNGSHISRANHLPFILAYDSEVLAEQFTIVEKDALDEIDWKELIELRWKQSANVTTCWVNYLQTEEPRGVDIVIARFNLMVKWVVSECVLTENLEERARCIVKYIHIAAHARRLRNYATMYQITVALVSSDCSRLKQTWDLVPAAEMQTMKELEAVIQPLRNFQNLRIEMETAPVEDGCIPFIGGFFLQYFLPSGPGNPC